MRSIWTATIVGAVIGLLAIPAATGAYAQFPGMADTPTPAGTARTATPTVARTTTPTRVVTTTPSTLGAPAGVQPSVPFTATLIGGAEVPGPGDEDGLGSAAITLDAVQGLVCYALHAVNIDRPTAAHIHEGAVGVAGSVVVPLAAPTDSDSSGCARDVDRELVARIERTPADFYINVHTAEFPDGAVRGQLGRY
jgi:hypothetical protein